LGSSGKDPASTKSDVPKVKLPFESAFDKLVDGVKGLKNMVTDLFGSKKTEPTTTPQTTTPEPTTPEPVHTGWTFKYDVTNGVGSTARTHTTYKTTRTANSSDSANTHQGLINTNCTNISNKRNYKQ
jgi:hypothetical protein